MTKRDQLYKLIYLLTVFIVLLVISCFFTVHRYSRDTADLASRVRELEDENYDLKGDMIHYQFTIDKYERDFDKLKQRLDVYTSTKNS